MGELSVWHWLIVAVVALLLFGYKRLPDASRSIGRSLRIFKSEMREFNEERADTSRAPSPPRALQSETEGSVDATQPAGARERPPDDRARE